MLNAPDFHNAAGQKGFFSIFKDDGLVQKNSGTGDILEWLINDCRLPK